jgi:trimeric autotransporter adhesin
MVTSILQPKVKKAKTNGVNAITLSFLIPASDLAAGFNTISVLYGGDTNYQASGANVSVALSGVSGSYALNGPGQPVAVEASQEGSTAIRVVPSNGFTGVVGMTCTVRAATTGHAPICQAAPVQVYGSSAASSVVSIATYADTPVGSYTITITGTSSQLTQTVQIPLQVTPGPGFALSAATSPLSIATPGQSTTDTLSIIPTQAFTLSVAFGCTVTPTPAYGRRLPAHCRVVSCLVQVRRPRCSR